MFPAARVSGWTGHHLKRAATRSLLLPREADILIGTQMIVKANGSGDGGRWRTYPHYAPDYRCGEQTFAL